MTDIEHVKKYAEDSISLAISMYNPKAEMIAEYACLYGLTYKNDEIDKLKKENEQLKAQIEKMKCCMNCKGYDTTLDGAVTCNKFRFYDCKSNITLNNENCIDYWELAEWL